MFLFFSLIFYSSQLFAIEKKLVRKIAYVEKTEIICPERYKNNSVLIDGNNLRYQGGTRLRDEELWRYPTGQRLVDDEGIIRYLHGQRLVDGKVWRYQDGSRLFDDNIFRYPNGKVMRNVDGTFKDQEGKIVPNESFEYAFATQDGTIVRIFLTKKSAEIVLHILDHENEYELAFAPQIDFQPKRILCRLNNVESVGQKFSITSTAAIVEVNVLAGKNPKKVKEAIEKALKSVE